MNAIIYYYFTILKIGVSQINVLLTKTLMHILTQADKQTNVDILTINLLQGT